MTSQPLAPGAAKPPLQIQRQRGVGADLVLLDHAPLREFHLTLTPGRTETIDSLIERLAQLLHQHQAVVVRHLVFGPVAAHAETLRAMQRQFGDFDWPVTWMEGNQETGNTIAGMQIHALAGTQVKTLVHRDRIVGRTFNDGEANHCVLGDLGPEQTAISAPEQARETFENLEAALGLAGMSLKNVARTWLFLDDILSWYGPLNQVRNDYFARHELRPGAFPASTGVAGKNPRGAAMVAAAWAVAPHHATAGVHFVGSPKQGAAPAYGSAFSRAVEIFSGTTRQVLVSGTASIAPEGNTVYVGDTARQIELTMEVVGAILEARGMSFADTARSVAYFKSSADMPLFAAWRRRHSLQAMPVTQVCCDICRADLLFELELDAIRVTA